MKSACLTLLLGLLAATSLAQHRLSISVTDSLTGEPLAGAIVQLGKEGPADHTGFDGSLIFRNLKEREYLLKVSYLGYQTYSTHIQLLKDQSLAIKLRPATIVQEAVIIRGTRIPAGGAATLTHVPREVLKEKNTGQDLPVLLSTIPSAVSTSDAGNGFGYTGLRIRGTDMTRINVTLNGIPYNDPESHEVYWVDLPDIASSIDNIDIQRGVGTSANGAAAFGGSINIQTQKTSADPYAEWEAAAGSFQSFRNSFFLGTGLINHQFSFDGRFSKISSEGYIDRASSRMNSYFLSGTWFGKNNMLKANVFSGKERTYLSWDGVPSALLETNRTYNGLGAFTNDHGITQYYENEVDDYRQNHYQILFNQQFNKSLDLNTAIFFTHGTGYYEQYQQETSLDKVNLTPVTPIHDTVDYIQRKWLENDFYGVSWSVNQHLTKFESVLGGGWNHYQGDHFGKVIWCEKEVLEDSYDYTWYLNKGEKEDANLFLKSVWTPLPSVHLLADLQYRLIHYSMEGPDDDFRNLTQQHDYNFWNPKAGINYSLNKRHKLSLAFGMAHREPSRTNFKDAEPGKTPRPERMINLEAGHQWEHSSGKSNINLYLMNYTDQLVLTGEINEVGAPVMVNVDHSYRMGIEFIESLKITTWLRWEANLTLSRNKVLDFVEYIDNWDTWTQIVKPLGTTDLAFSPEVIAHSLIEIKPKNNITVSLSSKYVGRQFVDNTSSPNRQLDPYLVNDLKISWQTGIPWFRESRISLQVNNLFNERYETNAWVYRYYSEGRFQTMDGYFPQAGLNFLAGLQLKI